MLRLAHQGIVDACQAALMTQSYGHAGEVNAGGPRRAKARGLGG